jgi:DNA-binding LytR/AlgR family response regulator
LRIALCDDDKALLDFVRDCLQNYAKEHCLHFIIDCFSSGEAFLESSELYDIIFMDIYLDGITGVDVVARLSTNSRQRVIFMSSSREHAVEAFGLGVAHYLVKPLTKEDVNAGIERCLVRLGEDTEKVLSVRVSHDTVDIPMGQIVYIEVFNKVSLIHTTNDVIQTYSTLKELFELLDKNVFLRAQRSYIINMGFVEFFLFDRIIMKNGMEIMLSRNNRGELKHQYQRFLFDMARGRAM